MKQTDQIELSVNRTRTLLLFLFCIGFLVLIVDTLRYDFTDPELTWINVLMIIVAALCVIGAFIFLRAFFDKKVKLIINSEGITENFLGGLVRWSEIEDIRLIKMDDVKYIVIDVKNPQEFINKRTIDLSERQAMETNIRRTRGAPIGFSATFYQMRSKKLHALLVEKLREYQEKTS